MSLIGLVGDSSAKLVDAWNVATVSDEVIVCQLRSGSMFCVPVSLNQLFTQAVVDTAAGVSLISEPLYSRLEPRPRFIKGVTLHTACKELDMNGYILGPVHLRLGKRKYSMNLYVAPIENEMLLGLDFLRTYGVSLDLRNETLKDRSGSHCHDNRVDS